MKHTRFNIVVKFVISLFLCQLAGGIGSVFTRSAISQWYVFIHKPAFTPPNWVFAPVWTILYALMGIALFLVWTKGLQVPGVKKALGVFLFQLALNSLWPIVFFGARSIFGGLVVIVVLWVAIVWTIRQFFALSKWAAALLVPYILWVSFALVLNGALFWLNK